MALYVCTIDQRDDETTLFFRRDGGKILKKMSSRRSRISQKRRCASQVPGRRSFGELSGIMALFWLTFVNHIAESTYR